MKKNYIFYKKRIKSIKLKKNNRENKRKKQKYFIKYEKILKKK